MNKITSFVKRYPLTVFFLLTFVLAAPMNLIANRIYDATHSIPLALPFAILSCGPLISAILVSAALGGRAEVAALLRKLLIWRVGWRWYAVALLLLPALYLVAIYLNVLLGAPAPTTASFGTWSAMLGTLALRLVNPWDGPVLEELGWRGFAQPQLQQRYSLLTANLILGLLVSLWHLPLILIGGYEWVYIPGTIAATILIGWVFNATGGSVLLTLIMHASEPVLQVQLTGPDATRYMSLLVLVYAITAVIVVLATGRNLGRSKTASMLAGLENAIAPT